MRHFNSAACCICFLQILLSTKPGDYLSVKMLSGGPPPKRGQRDHDWTEDPAFASKEPGSVTGIGEEGGRPHPRPSATSQGRHDRRDTFRDFSNKDITSCWPRSTGLERVNEFRARYEAYETFRTLRPKEPMLGGSWILLRWHPMEVMVSAWLTWDGWERKRRIWGETWAIQWA